jgi:hypothetical protein
MIKNNIVLERHGKAWKNGMTITKNEKFSSFIRFVRKILFDTSMALSQTFSEVSRRPSVSTLSFLGL